MPHAARILHIHAVCVDVVFGLRLVSAPAQRKYDVQLSNEKIKIQKFTKVAALYYRWIKFIAIHHPRGWADLFKRVSAATSVTSAAAVAGSYYVLSASLLY